MSKYIRVSFPNDFIVEAKQMAELVTLLSKGKGLKMRYSEESIKITKGVDYDCESFPEEKLDGILKAQVLGLTYEEYLNVERESTESV